MKCCKIGCDKEATKQMFDSSKDDACYNVSYACDDHVEDIKGDNEISEPICNL